MKISNTVYFITYSVIVSIPDLSAVQVPAIYYLKFLVDGTGTFKLKAVTLSVDMSQLEALVL